MPDAQLNSMTGICQKYWLSAHTTQGGPVSFHKYLQMTAQTCLERQKSLKVTGGVGVCVGVL